MGGERGAIMSLVTGEGGVMISHNYMNGLKLWDLRGCL